MPIIFAVIFFFVSMFGLAATGMDSGLVAVIVFFGTAAVLVGSVILMSNSAEKKRSESLSKVSRAVDLNRTAGTLKLKTRSSDIRTLVKFEKIIHGTLAHKDSEYIYTGVTVGGITTGGIHKTKEYDYVQSTQDMGLYKFLYDGCDIGKIYLTDELYAKAEKSYIAQYLNKSEKSIRLRRDMEISQGLQSMAGASLAFRNELSLAAEKTYPSKTQCEQVLNWICGGDYKW